MIALAQVTTPRDIPLTLPFGEMALKTWLVPLFLVHIFFVNLMVGGTLLTSIYEILGRRNAKYDRLAQLVGGTVTVNKSLAVVLGVGPLLLISLAYAVQWYGANAITGHTWLMVIPLVTIAFLLTYLHKYTWQRWSTGRMKALHIALGLCNVALFLFIPLIFLANVNLMHFPTHWEGVRGLFDSLWLANGNALGRYFHFLAASVAMTALFLAGWLTWTTRARAALPDGFTPGQAMRHFYRITLFVTLAQLAIGPILLLLLPRMGISTTMLALILCGVGLALAMMYVLLTEINAPDARIGRRWFIAAALMAGVALLMGSGRQTYREAALLGPQWDAQVRTAAFLQDSDQAYEQSLTESGGELTPEQLFIMRCGNCHERESDIAAPTLHEIADLYDGRPEMIVIWAKNPGRKRTRYSPMPSFRHLSDDELLTIARHMLEAGRDEASESD